MLPANFWAKTGRTDCTIWTGAVNSKGYGCFAVGGVSYLAHRLAYEDVRGPIADGMTIDHMCRVRNCVNVDHLEVVTVAENNRRKRGGPMFLGGECSRGHRLTEGNAYKHPRGHVECRECRRQLKAARRQGAAA